MKNLVKFAKRYREDIIAIEILVLVLLSIILAAMVSLTHPALGVGMFGLIATAVVETFDIDIELE